jgi:hypothetical protein
LMAIEHSHATDMALLGRLERSSKKARNAALKSHESDLLKRAAILKAWATGDYKTHEACANAKADGLGMAHKVALKALTKAPEPARRVK